MTQNQHTWLTLGKDLLFILVALFLIVKGRFLGAVIGVLALLWYGRDFSYRIKALGATKESKRDVERQAEPKRTEDTPIVDDGKIQVTDLSGAKEVDFEKE